jgi:hypothetical protein
MIGLNAEDVNQLLDALTSRGEKLAQNEPYQLAANWEDCVAISSYDLTVPLCRRSKGAIQRAQECDAFFNWISGTYVDFCEIGPDFVSFMMRHVRDSRLDLPQQVRQLHQWLHEYDYSNTYRR